MIANAFFVLMSFVGIAIVVLLVMIGHSLDELIAIGRTIKPAKPLELPYDHS